MAYSEIEICNRALSRAGQDDQLEDLEAGALLEDQPQSTDKALEKCRLHYPKVRDALLRRAPWPFATVREPLALIEDIARDDWAYVYAYPADCLALRRLIPAGVKDSDYRPLEIPEHRIEGRRAAEPPTEGAIRPIESKIILSDEPDLEIRYTVAVTNVAVFDAVFEDALIARLAAELAPSMVGAKEGAALRKECIIEAEGFLAQAWAAARMEEHHKPDPDGSIVASRR